MLTALKIMLQMYPLNDAWDRELEKVLGPAAISDASKRFIYRSNDGMNVGKWGYVGHLVYSMNGGNVHEPAAYGMWEDSCLHILGTKIVDDFFDLNGHSVDALLERCERLGWEQIKLGTRPRTYYSHEEEAAVFMLETLAERFENAGSYMSMMDDLYRAVIGCETAKEPEERRRIGLEVGELTLQPIAQLLTRHGSVPSDSLTYALGHFGRGSMIWDHLSDLYKDIISGAFNFVLDDAVLRDSGSPLEVIKNGLGRGYILQAKEEYGEGERYLSGKELDIYRAFRMIVEIKYWIKYQHALRKSIPNSRRLIGSTVKSA